MMITIVAEKPFDKVKNWCFWTVVLERTLECSLDLKEVKPVHPKGNQSWIFIGRTDAEAETLILWPPDVKSSLWKRPWCWERLKAAGEGDDRGWDGWMTSLTRWTWVWVNSGRERKTGKPGVLQFMVSQRDGHALVSEHQDFLMMVFLTGVRWCLIVVLTCTSQIIN